MVENVINKVPSSQYFLRASRIDPGSGRLRSVSIYDVGQAERRRIIYADSGLMGYTARWPRPRPEALPWLRPAGHLGRPAGVRAHHVRNAGNCLQGRLRPTRTERGPVGSRRPGNDELRAHGGGGQRAPGNPRREVPTCGTYPFRSPDPAGTAPGTCPSSRLHGKARRVSGCLLRPSGGDFRGRQEGDGEAGRNRTGQLGCGIARGRPGRFGPGYAAAPAPTAATTARLSDNGTVASVKDREMNAARRANRYRVEIHKKWSLSFASHPVRPDRGGHGIALPPRGHGPGPRRRHVRLCRLLRRPHRR